MAANARAAPPPASPMLSNEAKAQRADGEVTVPSVPRRWATATVGRVQHALDGEPWEVESAVAATLTGARAEADVLCAVDLRALSLQEASVPDEGLCLSMVRL
jgi:hypothetical protein